jgi:AAA15 family ATPase/GTPase
MELNDDYIKRLIEQHKRKLEYYKHRYHTVKKHDEEFIKQNRQRSKDHYSKNKESKKEYYDKNKAFINAKTSYLYYKRKNDVDGFKTKSPEKYQLLIDREYITSTE